jgi:hypothetical protein
MAKWLTDYSVEMPQCPKPKKKRVSKKATWEALQAPVDNRTEQEKFEAEMSARIAVEIQRAIDDEIIANMVAIMKIEESKCK